MRPVLISQQLTNLDGSNLYSIMQGESGTHTALLQAWRDDVEFPYRGQSACGGQQSRGVYAIVISQEYLQNQFLQLKQ